MARLVYLPLHEAQWAAALHCPPSLLQPPRAPRLFLHPRRYTNTCILSLCEILKIRHLSRIRVYPSQWLAGCGVGLTPPKRCQSDLPESNPNIGTSTTKQARESHIDSFFSFRIRSLSMHVTDMSRDISSLQASLMLDSIRQGLKGRN